MWVDLTKSIFLLEIFITRLRMISILNYYTEVILRLQDIIEGNMTVKSKFPDKCNTNGYTYTSDLSLSTLNKIRH